MSRVKDYVSGSSAPRMGVASWRGYVEKSSSLRINFWGCEELTSDGFDGICFLSSEEVAFHDNCI